MGAIAKGKVNASEVQTTDRIIVAEGGHYQGDAIRPSRNKTGEGVTIVRVLAKHKSTGRRGYVIVTSAGSFYAEPIQTMWLAPEDNAGIKRAHVEAIEEQGARWKQGLDEIWDEALAEDAEHNAAAEIEAGPRFNPEAGASAPDANRHESQTNGVLTPDSQAGKVDNMSSETNETQAPALITQGENTEVVDEALARIIRERTGSAVVLLLEKVWARIREDHPELPDVVMITGSGLVGASKWGHFRANGWKVKEEGAAVSTRMHEMFMAGETLAKGATQVLQTMLHEGAHTLAKVRELQDTSRQGRWHNATFRKLAEEMGLEHKGDKADKAHGFSFVTLTPATKDRYADLLEELDREIHLMCDLPGWLGGEDEDDKGGEKIGKKPSEGGSTSSGVKLTCACEEPNIIRASKKVADKCVVRCEDCGSAFLERG